MRHAILICLSFWSGFLAFPRDATAYESLAYGAALPPSSRLLLEEWLEQEKETELSLYEVAVADLNRDGIGEYVLKPRKCYGKGGFCTFIVLAEGQKGALVLGKISAKKLALGDSYHTGVQDILAFRSNNNDYEYDIFVWDPLASEYVQNGRTEG